jgi:hypothetical protein
MPETQRVLALLNAVIDEQGRKVSVLAKVVGLKESTLRAQLAGRNPLPAQTARRLALTLHIPDAAIDMVLEAPQAA